MAEPLAAEAAAIQSIEVSGGPKGIGGWLTLMAIGQVLGPLRVAANVMTEYSSAEMLAAFKAIPLATYGVLVIEVAYMVLVCVTAFVFFAQKRIFKLMFTWEVIGMLAVYLLSALWISGTTTVPVSKLLNADEIGKSLGAFIAGLIWLGYVSSSKRVRNTFVN